MDSKKKTVTLSVLSVASSAMVGSLFMSSPAWAKAKSSSEYGGTATYVVAPVNPFQAVFNPWSPSDSATNGGLAEIYEPLYYYNQYTGASVPKLATSYSYSSDHKTITIQLRGGVKWSDGKPFTSADVVFTLKMLMTHPTIDFNGLGQMISSVKAEGTSKVVVQLKSVNNESWYYIGESTPIVAEHVYGSVKNPATFADSNPVTTGPFLLKSVSKTLLSLKRNPNYWDHGKPYIDELDQPLYLDNNVAAMAMAQGKFDAATQFVPDIKNTLLNRDPKHFSDWFPPIGEVILQTNDQAYPTSLASFRQALSYAIDRNKVSTLGEYNMEPVGNSIALPPSKANQSIIDASVLKNNPLTYDPTKAKSILKQAGFKWDTSGKLIDPHGKVVSLTILVGSGTTDWIAGAQVVASNLGAIGINASVKTPSGSTMSNALTNGSYQLAFNWVDSLPAYLGYNALLNSQFTAPIGKPALSNTERWNDKQTDALLNEYPKEFSPAKQKAIMSQLEAIFAKDLPVIPLLHGVAWEQYNTSRFVGWPSQSNQVAAFAGSIDDMYIFSQVHK